MSRLCSLQTKQSLRLGGKALTFGRHQAQGASNPWVELDKIVAICAQTSPMALATVSENFNDGVAEIAFEMETSVKKKRHVFLSYCRENASDISNLRDYLVASGEAVWWDRDIGGGQDWKASIRGAMDDAYAVILCLSKESESRVTSGMFPEARDAIELYRQYAPGSVFLIPVRLSACEIPRIEIDATRYLTSLQYIDLFPDIHRNTGRELLLRAIRSSPLHP